MTKQTFKSLGDGRVWRLRMEARAQMIPDWPRVFRRFELTLAEINRLAKRFGVTPGTVDRVFVEEYEDAVKG